MEQLNKFYWVMLVISLACAGWGLSRWTRANAFIPEEPVAIAANRYSYLKSDRIIPLSRYALLQKGEMFFGRAPEPSQSRSAVAALQPVQPPQPEFRSKLLLYGVTKGTHSKDDRAVVGLAAEPNGETWLAKVGSEVAGETVVRIEEKGIWVKNATGKGRLGLRE